MTRKSLREVNSDTNNNGSIIHHQPKMEIQQLPNQPNAQHELKVMLGDVAFMKEFAHPHATDMVR